MIKQKEEKNLIVGLDIGTSKIVAIVAELQPDGLLNVIGLGHHSSKGLKKRRRHQYRLHYGGDSKSN